MKKRIVMIGTRFDTMGGISAVVNVYRSAGLFDRWPIEYIPTHCDGGRFDKIKTFALGFAKFIGLLLTRRICLLHAHVSWRASFWRKTFFMLPALLLKIPVILHLHSGGFARFYERECGSIQKRLVRYIFDHADRVVVLSTAWKQWAQGISVNPNIVAIHNPTLVCGKPALARDRDEILCLGRLGTNKGSYDLLEAVARLAQKYPNLRLVLGGDGEIAEVGERAQTLGIGDRVELLGWVRGEDKDRHLASARVYALPSYNEGLPMSLLEAMAAGLPILTTPVGGIPDAVSDQVEGFLVTPGDINAIVERLDRLLGDPALAEKMGAAARRKIETIFSAETVLPQVENLYRELGAA